MLIVYKRFWPVRHISGWCTTTILIIPFITHHDRVITKFNEVHRPIVVFVISWCFYAYLVHCRFQDTTLCSDSVETCVTALHVGDGKGLFGTDWGQNDLCIVVSATDLGWLGAYEVGVDSVVVSIGAHPVCITELAGWWLDILRVALVVNILCGTTHSYYTPLFPVIVTYRRTLFINNEEIFIRGAAVVTHADAFATLQYRCSSDGHVWFRKVNQNANGYNQNL